MNRHRRFLHKLLLIAVTYALVVPTLPQSVSFAADAGNRQDQQLPGKRIKVYKGQIVALRAKLLGIRNKGLARAMADMRRRGLRLDVENSISIVAFDESATARTAKIRPVSLTQDTISEGDYEITFYTYDNGNPDTWEGIVYVRTPQEESTYSGQIYDFGVPDNPDYWDVTYEVYYPSDGGDPQCDPRAPCPILMQIGFPAKAPRMEQVSYLPAKTLQTAFGFRGWLRRWWGCTKSRCRTAWDNCSTDRVSRFFTCGVLRCSGYAIGCLFQ